MPLHRLKDYYPNYQETIANGQMHSIDSYSLYTQGGEKIGSAKDILVDQSGRFRYLVVDTGPWIFGKSVLVPIGLANFDYERDRIYINGLSKSQVEHLPEYKDDMVVDEGHEEQVRSQYQPLASQRSSRQYMERTYEGQQPAEATGSLTPDRGGMQPLESDVRAAGVSRDVRETQARRTDIQADQPTTASASAYDYERDPSYYGLSEEENHGPLRLFEERLIAHRNRSKVGEVSVGKRIVTETAEVSEPIEKERVVIERREVTGDAIPGTAADRAFENQEVARMEVYEEEVSVEKQPFVREEVTVRKETDHETVRSREQVRREELDVKTDGNPRINQ